MPNVVCPKCGNQQDGGIQCRKCFAFLDEAQPHSGSAAGHAEAPATGRSALRALRRVYRVISLATLVVLIAVVLLVLRKTPPPQVSTDSQAGARVESKLREAQSAVEAGRPHQLRLDQAELNAFLAANLALKQDSPPAGGNGSAAPAGKEPALEEVQSSVRDVKINMLDDRVQAYVLFDFHGKDLSLVLEGRLRAENGYLRFEPTSGKLGSLPIPQSTLENAVQRMLASPENREKLRLPPDIGDIRIENGELVLSHR